MHWNITILAVTALETAPPTAAADHDDDNERGPDPRRTSPRVSLDHTVQRPVATKHPCADRRGGPTYRYNVDVRGGAIAPPDGPR